jgi:flavin reductase (DIM6/NTAB) family NADH-FMN oxidoreductase RutF
MDATAAATLIAWLDQEIWLVTSQAGEQRGGLIATFVIPASIVAEVPRMLLGIAKQHHTWGLIESSGVLGLHLLGEQHLEWVWRFGLQSGRDVDKFEGVPFRMSPSGSPLLEEAIGWMDCRVETRTDTGDRTLYLVEVVESRVTHFAQPLTARRLMQLASPAKLAELKRQRHIDSLADAEAIRTWRAARQGDKETRRQGEGEHDASG